MLERGRGDANKVGAVFVPDNSCMVGMMHNSSEKSTDVSCGVIALSDFFATCVKHVCHVAKICS